MPLDTLLPQSYFSYATFMFFHLLNNMMEARCAFSILKVYLSLVGRRDVHFQFLKCSDEKSYLEST